MTALPRRTRRRLGAALALALAAAVPARAGEASPEPAPSAAAAQAAEPDHPAEAGKPAPAPRPADGALAPYAAVRSLQALQDQVAHGNAAARAAQAKMLSHVAEVFAGADPALWKDQRNAGAMALYLFSAGRPTVVRAVLERTTLSREGDLLVKGALAYAEGQDEIARALLGKLNPRALPASLGGHLALVMATLLSEHEPARAEAMLDLARLLVPGTLVEEAALRRQIFLLADPLTLDKFAALSRQYIRRFRGSVFASNFKGRLTSFATRLAEGGDVAQLAKLDAVFGELPQAERRGLYLALARGALVAGQPDSARYASGRAVALSPDAGEAERAKLYAAAASAASDGAPAARGALAAVDGARLPPRDLDLRDAALAVAASVDGGLGDRGPGRNAETGDVQPEAATAALLDRARRAMEAGDALLARAGPPPAPPAPPAPMPPADGNPPDGPHADEGLAP